MNNELLLVIQIVIIPLSVYVIQKLIDKNIAKSVSRFEGEINATIEEKKYQYQKAISDYTNFAVKRHDVYADLYRRSKILYDLFMHFGRTAPTMGAGRDYSKDELWEKVKNYHNEVTEFRKQLEQNGLYLAADIEILFYQIVIKFIEIDTTISQIMTAYNNEYNEVHGKLMRHVKEKDELLNKIEGVKKQIREELAIVEKEVK